MMSDISPEERTPSESTSKVIARLMVVATSAVFGGHVTFFAVGVVSSPLEVVYNSGSASSTLYAGLLGFLQLFATNVEFTARGISVLCGLVTLAILWRMGTKWSGDFVAGAAITLGIALFPVSAYVVALATPIALMMLLSVAALWCVTLAGPENRVLWVGVAGVVSGFLPFLDASGVGPVLAITVLVVATHQNLLSILTYGAATGAVFGALFLFYPLVLTPEVLPDSINGLAETFADGVLRPYAMLWVGVLLSGAVLIFSPTLRRRMGLVAVQRSVFMLIAFVVAVVWVVVIYPTHTGRLIAFSTVLGFGVMSCLPLVLWLRWVMPLIQSVWIWILLPVVMYSCFWVVLGPIDWAGFPYNQIASPQG